MRDPDEDPASAMSFSVTVGTIDLGPFTACDGLGFEVTVEQHEEGGNHAYVHQLPGRIKYTNVKLTRPVGSDTAKVAQWVSTMSTAPVRTTAKIVAMTHEQKPVVQWSLDAVFPVKWSGPQMSTDNSKIATETLELAHHGFNFAETYGLNADGQRVS